MAIVLSSTIFNSRGVSARESAVKRCSIIGAATMFTWTRAFGRRRITISADLERRGSRWLARWSAKHLAGAWRKPARMVAADELNRTAVGSKTHSPAPPPLASHLIIQPILSKAASTRFALAEPH